MVDLVPLLKAPVTFEGPDVQTEPHLATTILRKVDDADWARREKAQQSGKPSKLEWTECKYGAIRGRKPPLENIVAGTESAYRIAIVIVGADSKPLMKQTAVRVQLAKLNMLTKIALRCQGASISMIAVHRESGTEWSKTLSAENSPDVTVHGHYVFNLLPPSAGAVAAGDSIGLGRFAAAGTYLYKFRCVELILPTKDFIVQANSFPLKCRF